MRSIQYQLAFNVLHIHLQSDYLNVTKLNNLPDVTSKCYAGYGERQVHMYVCMHLRIHTLVNVCVMHGTPVHITIHVVQRNYVYFPIRSAINYRIGYRIHCWNAMSLSCREIEIA